MIILDQITLNIFLNICWYKPMKVYSIISLINSSMIRRSVLSYSSSSDCIIILPHYVLIFQVIKSYTSFTNLHLLLYLTSSIPWIEERYQGDIISKLWEVGHPTLGTIRWDCWKLLPIPLQCLMVGAQSHCHQQFRRVVLTLEDPKDIPLYPHPLIMLHHSTQSVRPWMANMQIWLLPLNQSNQAM